MTTVKDFLWTAEPVPFGAEWQISSEGGERVVFCGLPKETCEAIAMTHNWEIQRIDVSGKERKP
jgi:hypothetical protein